MNRPWPISNRQTGWPFTATPEGDKKQLVVDYYLESRGGGTILRLIHSGFGVGPLLDVEHVLARIEALYEGRAA